MKHTRLFLIALAILALAIGGFALSSCTEADAGYDDFASQISSAPGTSPTSDNSVPSFVLPDEVTGESEVLMANVDFGTSEEYDLGRYKIATANGTLTVYTADGMKAASFKMNGGKMVPTGTQPMENQALPVYSGPPGDSFSSFHIYPGSHETGDGMQPFFGIDHDGGQVTITPGEDISIPSRKSRGHTREGGGSGGCSTGSSGGG